ncbi:uncharacterized protein LOC122565332 isoform X2 [Chiloscyllium plagiosum]|uniref:uncharacterized protein LOC122565332 isoform X2 n=1 Tax=Chiloscyllium plagiosum TaxID=36176 RepID=UPI001CB85479|nr:uncharacterized protein LOC122565332 isoform X2 [Chiloscyllium plagiosum]
MERQQPKCVVLPLSNVFLLITWWMSTVQVSGYNQTKCQLKLAYSKSTIYAVEGGEFSLSCTMNYCRNSSSVPELNWCKQTSTGCTLLSQLEEFVNRTTSYSHFGPGTMTSVLHISPAHMNHRGVYQCQGQLPSYSPATVMGHMITVLVKKFKMIIPNSKMRGQKGGFLKLHCTVKFDENLNNILKVFWTKDNENCSQSMPMNSNSIHNESMERDRHNLTLILSKLQNEDAGNYYCCAATYLSSQIIARGSINVQIYAFNHTLLNTSLLIACKAVVLVIVVAVGFANRNVAEI